MSGRKLNIVITGDSAGASVAANVVFKIIEHNLNPANRLAILPSPIALVFSYAALDFNFTSWMTPDNLRVLQTEERDGSFPGLKELAAQKDHLKHVSPLSMVGDKRPGVPRRKPLKRQTSWKDTIRGLTSGGEKSGGEKSGDDAAASEPRKRRSSSALKTPKSRRSTFLEPRHRPNSLDGEGDVPTDQEDEDENEQDYAKYREEDRPIQARVRYVYPDSTSGNGSAKGGIAIPRSKSAVVKQQHELSVAVEEANTRATEQFGGKGKQKEPIGTRLTMTSRTGYFQDRVITPSMVGFLSRSRTND